MAKPMQLAQALDALAALAKQLDAKQGLEWWEELAEQLSDNAQSENK